MISLLKKAIVDLPIRMKRNSKRMSGKSLNPLGAKNTFIGTDSQDVTNRGLILTDERPRPDRITCEYFT